MVVLLLVILLFGVAAILAAGFSPVLFTMLLQLMFVGDNDDVIKGGSIIGEMQTVREKKNVC